MAKEKYIDGGYVDLDDDVHIEYGGERLTNARADELADELERTGPGRPSLAGGTSGRSPRVAFRVPDATKDALDRVARREGRRPSEVAREALEDYLASH